MCGILGFSGQATNAVENMMLDLLVRGYHSVGIAGGITFENKPVVDIKEIIERKYNAVDFVHQTVSRFRQPHDKFIFSNRYCTSGTWEKLSNAQPIWVDNSAIVMNGVISMAPKSEFEKEFGVQCTTENDTEIVLRLFLKGLQVDEIARLMPKASIACAILHEGKIIAFRNNSRPLYHYTGEGGNRDEFVVSSIHAIQASKHYDWEQAKIVPPNEVVII